MLRNLSLLLLLLVSGCTALTPELVSQLADSDASFCATADARGGAGSIAAPTGGYGQSTMSVCRSKMPNAKITLSPDGSISIEHGEIK